jgi:hypothetical protein
VLKLWIYLMWYNSCSVIDHLNAKYWDHMKNMISRVLGVLVFASSAGGISAEPITDTVTAEGSASVKADAAMEGAEYTTTNTNTGQMAGRVFINPETGELGGPPAGAEPPGLSIATQNRLNRSDKNLQIQHLPDGTMLMDLQGRFQNMSVVTLDQDGEAHLTCSHSVDQLEKALVLGADLPIDHGESVP